ncbi:MAG: lytic transglycosylase domain-containing protein [Nanoarchaeota archaeon]|nr:lytic transglycosylase domain-containing protein [Nanoarchaeota archaeon]
MEKIFNKTKSSSLTRWLTIFSFLLLTPKSDESKEFKPVNLKTPQIVSYDYYNTQNLKEPIKLELSATYKPLVDLRVKKILKSKDKELYEERRSLFSQYDDYSGKSNVDLSLLESLVIVESKVNPRAKSPTGPMGLGQFSRETAQRNGAIINYYLDDRLDPEKTLTELIPNHLSEILNLYKNIGINHPSFEQVLYTYHEGKPTRLSGKKLYSSCNSRLRYYITEIGALKDLIEKNSLGYELLPLYSERLENTSLHIFRENETIYSLASLNNTTIKEILIVNPLIRNINKIPLNYPLRIPTQ